uniref:Uncharacterized protein n=1 Tax=Malurus cyaneus samueli TaxID=2593467 RepID=A0A8C5T384_9PASS
MAVMQGSLEDPTRRGARPCVRSQLWHLCERETTFPAKSRVPGLWMCHQPLDGGPTPVCSVERPQGEVGPRAAPTCVPSALFERHRDKRRARCTWRGGGGLTPSSSSLQKLHPGPLRELASRVVPFRSTKLLVLLHHKVPVPPLSSHAFHGNFTSLRCSLLCSPRDCAGWSSLPWMAH